MPDLVGLKQSEAEKNVKKIMMLQLIRQFLKNYLMIIKRFNYKN